MSKEKTSGMKSAYELALERMEKQGIAPPRQDALSEDTRAEMAAVRQRADAKLAELEILYRDRLAKGQDPAQRQKVEEEYQIDRQRIEAERDRKLEALRGS